MLLLRLKINTVLPIVLVLVLPGLSFFSKQGVEYIWGMGMIGSWLVSSTVLYGLWHLLWYSWRDTPVPKRYVALFFLPIYLLLMHWLRYHELDDLKQPYFFRLILASVLFLTIQYVLKSQQNIARLRLEKEQILSENYRVQLRALRTKIDPHFLFNSLNTLRSMVRQQHVNSEQFVMSLSDFYRQMLKHHEQPTLQLAEELVVLESYLFLMKNRNEEAISVKMDIDNSLGQLQLPTLALQLVVENCFKHNSMTSAMPLHIKIRTTQDHYLEVCNNIQAKLGEKSESGHGLNLLRKRYELLRVEEGVIVEQTPDQFCIRLKLLNR